jgi:hypothetical protein
VDSQRKGLRTVVLAPGALVQVYLPKERLFSILLCGENGANECAFRKYNVVGSGGEISVGRGQGSTIQWANPHVSSKHADLL